MATYQVAFDPTVDDYDTIIGMVNQAYVDDLVEVDDTPPEAPDGWTAAKMLRYVRHLAPTGLLAFRAMAESAPEADAADVQAATGLYGMEFAGAMSTFGHAKRNTRGVRYLPFRRHGGIYHMDDKVAALALAALTRIGA